MKLVNKLIDKVLALPKVKGWIGEKHILSLLENLDKRNYKLLNNVIIETSKGKLTQIDHIVVSPYGLFVIETKNYSGAIYGKEGEEYWTQKLGDKAYKLYNPVKQNQWHITALESILNNPIKVIGVVCFTEKAKLNVKTHSSHVVNSYELLSVISSYNEKMLSLKEVDKIYKEINSKTLKGWFARRKHLKYVKYVKSVKK